jgi:hypothetical protein
MKQPNRPARWQLDLFILLMISVLLFFMWAELPQGWYTIIEVVWPMLVLCGMGVWCWVHKEPSAKEDQQLRKQRNQQSQAQRRSPPTCTIPLSPVQKHFLDVMNKHRWN